MHENSHMAIWVFKIPNNVRLREGMGKEQKERGECRLEVLDSEDEREGKRGTQTKFVQVLQVGLPHDARGV